MATASLFALKVASGATGASHTATSKRFRGFAPGQNFFLGFLYKADRTSGVGILQLRARINWYNAAGTALTPTDHDVSVDADVVDFVFIEKKHLAPAAAVEGEVAFIATPAASPMQHDIWVTGVRLAKTEAGADVTTIVDGPSTASFAHSSAGVAESGEFPRNLAYKLLTAAGTVSSGITWTYTVTSGTVNGFTSASGAQSISGSGAVSLTVSSMASSSATVTITATYNGVARTKVVTLEKVFAAPPTGGGGSSTTTQTSGFVAVTSSGFTTISAASPTLSTTLAAGKTQADVTVTLSFNPTGASPIGANNIQTKVQRDIASVWTDIGAAQDTNPDANIALEEGLYVPDQTGETAYTINDTGLTAGNTYVHRVQGKYTTGSANHQPFGVTGSIVTSVP